MKRLSLQWRMTLLTALLIAGACICLNLLLYRSGATGMDSLNGYIMQYQLGDAEGLAIEIPDAQMTDFIHHFSQEVDDAKVLYGHNGWVITSVVTLLSAAIAYFVSGRALKPLKQLSRQTEKINQDSIASLRLDEDTVQEFQQLSQSVNHMLDRLAQSFDTQRQFTGNAAHELRTPLALMQTRLELFAAEHRQMSEETAKLLHFQQEQVERLSALVRTLLEMSDLQSVPRTDCIDLAPMAEEVLVDLTPLAQKNGITLTQTGENVQLTGSDVLLYRVLFNLTENAIKYNRDGGRVDVREPRRLKKGERVFTGRTEDGSQGIFVWPYGFEQKKGNGDVFAFRQGRSRETAFSRDYDELYDVLRHDRDHGKIVWVLGPACVFDHDSRAAMESLINNGYCDALFAGNALATHDLEGDLFHTGLGQDIYTKHNVPNGHYHHLHTINLVRKAGGIKNYVEQNNVRTGIIQALVRNNIPYVLAGSIRDDGPLPDVIPNVYDAQDAMRKHTSEATTVIALATQLHTIATGNMTPSYQVVDGIVRPVYFYVVDLSLIHI